MTAAAAETCPHFGPLFGREQLCRQTLALQPRGNHCVVRMLLFFLAFESARLLSSEASVSRSISRDGFHFRELSGFATDRCLREFPLFTAAGSFSLFLFGNSSAFFFGETQRHPHPSCSLLERSNIRSAGWRLSLSQRRLITRRTRSSDHPLDPSIFNQSPPNATTATTSTEKMSAESSLECNVSIKVRPGFTGFVSVGQIDYDSHQLPNGSRF
jgi:hypothetical protein